MKTWLWRLLNKLGIVPSGHVFYVGGADILPPPLKGQEEIDALQLLEQGNEAAKQLLIERNLRLVVFIARRFENTGVNLEDLISIGTIGLIKAINTYQVGHGTALATYTARCIENEILMLIRSNKKHKNTLFLSDPVGTDKDGNILTLMDLLFEKEDCVFEQVEHSVQRERLLKDLKEILTEKEYTIICLRYALKGGVPLAQREVANVLKISRSYISRIEKHAIEKLRANLRPEDFLD